MSEVVLYDNHTRDCYPYYPHKCDSTHSTTHIDRSRSPSTSRGTKMEIYICVQCPCHLNCE